jgi:YbbR domain-containing protein
LIVEGDGKILYKGNSLGMGSQPEKINVDVTGVSKLTLKLEANKYFLIYDSKGILNDPTITYK